MSDDTQYVFFVRLQPGNGFYNMGDVIGFVGDLTQRGIDCRFEPTPGAPLEGVTIYNLMVRVDQTEAARVVIEEINPDIFKTI